jgi:hypothetical protein
MAVRLDKSLPPYLFLLQVFARDGTTDHDLVKGRNLGTAGADTR